MKCSRCKRKLREPKEDGWINCHGCGMARFVGIPVPVKKGKKSQEDEPVVDEDSAADEVKEDPNDPPEKPATEPKSDPEAPKVEEINE